MTNLENIARRLRQQADQADIALSSATEACFPSAQDLVKRLKDECERAATDIDQYVDTMHRAAIQASGKPGL
ncbi:MAG: hypothetical protein OEU92_31870 [Alphaproteobacteria bacterium]|nr:hypothetical protein [Alphaproteobacteria bacterium]